MLRSPKPYTTFALLAALAGASACTGQIGDGPAAPPNGSGAGAAGASGSGSTPGGVAADPGRVTMHRLNRVEYNNTVRDLLGTALHPADEFPPDDRGDGFDNIAAILTLSPLQIGLYQGAAAALVEELVATPSQRARFIACDLVSRPEACATEVLRQFAPRAWRRPVRDDEMASLMTPVRFAIGQGDGAEVGLKLALQAVLLSPHFIFRVELDASPTAPTAHPLGQHELASRLSYFLWSTMPDDELFAAANAGALATDEELELQVRRMVHDPKADALVENFAGQWLQTRKVDEAMPDRAAFPQFDEALRTAMKSETQLLFREVAFNGLAVDRLLTADFTFVNDRLARHYGLPLPGSTQLQRIPLSGSDHRGGLLGQAALLTVTSHATRTSPVLRGKWVLSELLCHDIPPPPPDVSTNLDAAGPLTGTLRQRMQKHRVNSSCASCHAQMDPIGFGLENYDGIGAYRTDEGSAPIDASGELPDGRVFAGPRELSEIIASDPDFARCLASKLDTYALGRGLELDDPAHLDVAVLADLANTLVKSGFQLEELITRVVKSATFRNRRGEPSELAHAAEGEGR